MIISLTISINKDLGGLVYQLKGYHRHFYVHREGRLANPTLFGEFGFNKL